jgi:diguanylate cyclase (GGDEF)-like protein
MTIVASMALHSTSEASFKLFTLRQKQVAAAEEVADRLAESRLADSIVLLSSNAGTLTAAKPTRDSVGEEIALLATLTKGEPISAKVRELRARWAVYGIERSRMMTIAESGDKDDAYGHFSKSLALLYHDIDMFTDELAAQILQTSSAEGAAARTTGLRLTLIVFLFGGAGVAATLLMLFVGKHRLAKPLADITNRLAQLAAGRLDLPVEGGSRGDEIGALIRALEIFRDNASELDRAHRETQEAQARAEALARHDPLTGLPNRRLLTEFVERVAARDDERVALLMVDLDRFKPVNDQLGQQAGDETLCVLADRLTRLHPDYKPVRLGGDEFALLVPLGAGNEDAIRASAEVLQAASEPMEIGGKGVTIGATIGIAVYPDDGRDAGTLLRAADLAMYRAKVECKGGYRFYEATMQDEVDRSTRYDGELQRAIATGEIQPFYQPLVSINGPDLVGFEVLARWIHPERGTIMPDDFIPAADARGLLPQLTYSILRQACRDARTWPDHIRLSINLAPSQLRDPLLVRRLAAILNEHAMPAHRIEIEITENALIGDMETTKKVLIALQKLGMTIALDDFGTGYASLFHLRELNFDKIKVDKSFVQATGGGDENAKIVRAMIALGKSLGLTVTAEGIEDQAQWMRLAAWGCDYGQGYLFGCAMDKTKVDALLGKLIAAQPMHEAARLRGASAA